MKSNEGFLKWIAYSDLSKETLDLIIAKSKHTLEFFNALIYHVIRIGNRQVAAYILNYIKDHQMNIDDEAGEK